MYKYPNRPIREVYGRDKLRISEAKINKPGAAPEPDHRWLGRMFSEGAVEGTHPVRRDGAEEKGLRQALSVNFSCSKGRTCSAQLKLHQMRRICVFLEDGGGGDMGAAFHIWGPWSFLDEGRYVGDAGLGAREVCVESSRCRIPGPSLGAPRKGCARCQRLRASRHAQSSGAGIQTDLCHASDPRLPLTTWGP